MQEVSRPPRIITALSEQDRLLISQLIQEKDNLGMAWLEKLRKFISRAFDNINPTQPDVSDHGRDLRGGKSYPPYKFSIKTVQMNIKFML